MVSRKTKRIQTKNFELLDIEPLTKTQKKVFDEYDQNKNLVLHGYAGTGKTFLSLYLALDEIINTESPYKSIKIVRSVVPSRDIGFLPGNVADKAKVYEEPYKQIVDELFSRGDGYILTSSKKLIEFTTTSFLRGLTFNNSIVILDEIQNMSFAELYTTLTRFGENSRFILCGDYRQTDLKKRDRDGGIQHMMNILKSIPSVSVIEFGIEDICRSGFVKEFITESAHYMEKNGIAF